MIGSAAVRPQSIVRALSALAIVVASRAVAAQDRPVLDEYKVPVITLRGEDFGSQDVFASPTSIVWVDGQLIIIDRQSDPKLFVLDAKTGAIVRRFGRDGAGPGEFKAPWDIAPSGRYREFWIYDTSLRRMTLAHSDRSFTDGVFRPIRSVALEGGANLNSVRWTAEGTFIATGYLRRGLFAVYDSTGRERPPRGDFTYGDPRLPVFARQQAYESRITLDPARAKIAVAFKESDRLEFFASSGQRLGLAQRPFGFEPSFAMPRKRDDEYIAGTQRSRTAYRNVIATQSTVFSLFSGRRYREFKSEAAFGRHVHVHSWDGTLRMILELDASAIAIAVDPEETVLFASVHDPVPRIVRYALPPILRSAR